MPGVKTAMPLKDVIKKLCNLAAAASSLRQAISGQPCPDLQNVSLEQIVNGLLEDLKPLYFTTALLGLLDAINGLSIYASGSFIKEIERGGDTNPSECFSENEWWNLWVHILTRIMIEHGLPYQARKDSDKSKHEVPSAFVSFVFELQKYMPVGCWKYTHSLDALAQAINRARQTKAIKPEKSGNK
jgi:hypothetical protein